MSQHLKIKWSPTVPTVLNPNSWILLSKLRKQAIPTSHSPVLTKARWVVVPIAVTPANGLKIMK
jgi:hypothetical protein